MKIINYSWEQVEGACLDIARQMINDEWKPDYIVGITRGGLIPANLLSQYLSIPMKSLNVSLRDYSSQESNCWMAEDAFGYQKQRQKILIVDDINDTGATISWIKADWQACCFPDSPEWDSIWGDTVRFATITNNIVSKETVDYGMWDINKSEIDCWIVYPWERFWDKK